MKGSMVIGPVEHKSNVRFESMDDFESYKNALDVGYDSGDVTFTGYVYILSTPQFKVVKRSAYDESANYMKESFEYRGQNWYIPTSGKCFINCTNYFINKGYTEKFRDFFRNEKDRSVFITFDRSQPFCNNYDIIDRCFDRMRTNLEI